MNVKFWLPCVIASLFFVSCGNRTRNIPVNPNIDQEYLNLVKQGEELSEQAFKWNKTCSDNSTTKDCVADQGVLTTLWSQYLIRALKYRSSGDDCRASMRNKIIGFNIHIALFNIRCGGVEHTGQDQIDCTSESAFIEQERVDLHVQMADCQEQIQGLKK